MPDPAPILDHVSQKRADHAAHHKKARSHSQQLTVRAKAQKEIPHIWHKVDRCIFVDVSAYLPSYHIF